MWYSNKNKVYKLVKINLYFEMFLISLSGHFETTVKYWTFVFNLQRFFKK